MPECIDVFRSGVVRIVLTGVSLNALLRTGRICCDNAVVPIMALCRNIIVHIAVAADRAGIGRVAFGFAAGIRDDRGICVQTGGRNDFAVLFAAVVQTGAFFQAVLAAGGIFNSDPIAPDVFTGGRDRFFFFIAADRADALFQTVRAARLSYSGPIAPCVQAGGGDHFFFFLVTH